MAGRPTSPPKRVKDLMASDENYGASEAYLVTYEDGSRGIFKPADPPKASPSDADGISNPDNEVAAYRLARLLGYDAVPYTDYSTVEAETVGMGVRDGSVQSWVEEAVVQCWIPDCHTRDSREAVTQRTEMALFDQVIGNCDRHGENVIRDSGGKWWAVDHGLAFYFAEGINLREVFRMGSFGTMRPLPRWRGMQLKLMAETLAAWGRVPCQDIETTLVGCDKGDGAEWVYERIRELTAEAQSGRWS